MNDSMSRKDAPPWYKQGWPWFLIAPPAVAVIAGFITLWIAVSTFDGLVVDDYYQQGKVIEQTIARSVRAGEMGLAAELKITADEVRISLSSTRDAPLPPGVLLTIAHPTRSGRDQKLLLQGRDGVFSGPLQPLSAGRWLVQVEDESETWRLNGTAHLPAETEIRIVAGHS
jgi:hypothetical protein